MLQSCCCRAVAAELLLHLPRRISRWAALLTLGFLITLSLGIVQPAGLPEGGADGEPLVEVTPINWRSNTGVEPTASDLPLLQVGGYVTNVSDINLLENQFSIELLILTLWQGEPERNPSDQLRVLNGIYDGDVQRFERVRRDVVDGASWSLYKVRSEVVKRWWLQHYPFDEQLLHVQIGLDDPLQPINIDVML